MSRYVKIVAPTGQAISTVCDNFTGNAKGLCNTNMDLITTCCVSSQSLGTQVVFSVPTDSYEELKLSVYNLSTTAICSTTFLSFGNSVAYGCCCSCFQYLTSSYTLCGRTFVCSASSGCTYIPITCNSYCNTKFNMHLQLRQHLSCGYCKVFAGEVCMYRSGHTQTVGGEIIQFSDAGLPCCSCMYWEPCYPDTCRLTRVAIINNASCPMCSQGDFYWELYGRKYQNINYPG